jgi:hypothetical protein
MLHGFTAQNIVYENKIAAYVEDRIITTQQIHQEATRSEISLQKALDALSEKIIIVKEFDRMHGQIPTNLVKQEYDKIKNRFGDNHEKFICTLAQKGKTEQSFKNEVRENTIIRTMYDHNVTRPSIASPRDIQDYYDTHKSELKQERQISFDQIETRKENQKSIEEIKNYIKNGGDYEEIFQHLSKIPDVKVNRDDGLPYADILPMVAQKVETIALNSFSDESMEISDHIMFFGLRKIEEEHPLTLAEANGRVERILLDKRYRRLRQDWLDSLRKKAYYIVL